VGKLPANADIAEASSVVPTSKADDDESAVTLTWDIGVVTSYVEPILAVEMAVVVVIPATEESQGVVLILL
jgi:hypothetical protein